MIPFKIILTKQYPMAIVTKKKVFGSGNIKFIREKCNIKFS
jgi:hypothetical protein